MVVAAGSTGSTSGWREWRTPARSGWSRGAGPPPPHPSRGGARRRIAGTSPSQGGGAGTGDRDDLTFDHVIPRSRGGRTTWQNVVTACSSCNADSSRRTIAATPVSLAPIAYNLGVSVGWKRFAVAGDVTRVELPAQPGSTERANLGVSYAGSRVTGRVQAAAERPLANTPVLIGDKPRAPQGPSSSGGVSVTSTGSGRPAWLSPTSAMVRVDESGAATYHATYTAFDGTNVAGHLLSTDDFRSFTVSPLAGAAFAKPVVVSG